MSELAGDGRTFGNDLPVEHRDRSTPLTYSRAIQNAEAFVRTMREIRALPTTNERD